MNPVLWNPPASSKETRMARFMESAAHYAKAKSSDYDQLQRWSVENFEVFWRLCLQDLGVQYVGKPDSVYKAPANGKFYGGQWFPRLQLNFTQNMLHRLADTPLVGIDELGRRKEIKRQELLGQVRGLQNFLAAKGVGPGDSVVGYLPNCPEAVVALLATASLGAVWSSTSPDFGPAAVLDRFSQLKPKVLFCADGYSYGGKSFDLRSKNQEVAKALSSLQASVEIPFLAGEKGDSPWAIACRGDKQPPEFRLRSFQDPLYVMFSSGTTGVPKCIVHSIGGTLLQHAKELMLHCDLKENEKILYFTTCGWMMWNWMLSSLFAGATVYCFDGSPAHPGPEALWKWVDSEGIDVFGTSAKFIGSCRSAGLEVQQQFKLSKTRLVLSTGSPLLPEDFDYFYSSVDPGKRIQLASICGGTDIISCFMLGTPLKPVRRGEIQAAGLGMDVRAFDAKGKALQNERGELVCGTPFPSMPTSFLHDPQNEKLEKAYFKKFPGVWHHGDYITLTEAHGIVVHGRSDSTLNPGGVRIGTAEIYNHVESHPDVADSLAIGQRWRGDERILLFLRLKDPKAKVSPQLADDIKRRIREGCSPRHVPAHVLAVPDIPYTLSGKKVEVAVKQLIHGEEPQNLDAMSNPQSLDFFRKLEVLD